jgi:hypothetical protein
MTKSDTSASIHFFFPGFALAVPFVVAAFFLEAGALETTAADGGLAIGAASALDSAVGLLAGGDEAAIFISESTGPFVAWPAGKGNEEEGAKGADDNDEDEGKSETT